MTFKTLSLILVLPLLLSSCATSSKKPTDLSGIAKAHWETKVRVNDLEKDKSHNLSVDFLGERGGPFRMEATALMGVPVASLVATKDEVRFALYRQKSFYIGEASEEALRPILKIPVSPSVLSRIAFDEPLGTGWKCVYGNDGLISSCESVLKKMKITWNRVEEKRQVRLAGPGFEMDWIFGEPRTDVQFREETFRLDAPSGFKVIRL